MTVLYLFMGVLFLVGAAVMNPLSFVIGLVAGATYRRVAGPDIRPGVVVSFLIGATIGFLAGALFDVGYPILGPWATVVGFYASRWVSVDAARAR